MDIVFHRLARIELTESRDYYDSIFYGLGERFIMDFEKSMDMIKESPEIYPIVIENIRRCNLQIFPFSVFYDIIDNKVRILAISHQKRNPYYWTERI